MKKKIILSVFAFILSSVLSIHAQMIKAIVNDAPVSGGGTSNLSTTPVQKKKKLSNVASASLAFDSAVQAGSLLVAFIDNDGNAITVSGVSDATNGSWTAVPSGGSAASAGTNHAYMFCFSSSAAASITVSASTTGGTNIAMWIGEFRTPTGSCPTAVASNAGADVNFAMGGTIGPVATTLTNAVLLYGTMHGTANTACTGFTNLDTLNWNGLGEVQVMQAGAPGNYSVAGCQWNNFSSAGILAAFQ